MAKTYSVVCLGDVLHLNVPDVLYNQANVVFFFDKFATLI